jgi:hypothetical protein
VTPSDRVRIGGTLPTAGMVGLVLSVTEDPTGTWCLVLLDGDDMPLRFGADALELCGVTIPAAPLF